MTTPTPSPCPIYSDSQAREVHAVTLGLACWLPGCDPLAPIDLSGLAR